MFNKVAVLGSGVMGAGIACQLANNKIEVLLFDLEKQGSLIAEEAIKQQILSTQSALVHQVAANLITPMSLERDLKHIESCDLVIEVIVENLDIKQRLYKEIEQYLSNDVLIVSNTSTFTLSALSEGLTKNIKSRIAICHFFNPPRYMKLLECVAGEVKDSSINRLKDFLTFRMGKDVIMCYDSPGFIANRLGCFLMEIVLQRALGSSLPISQIDEAFKVFCGFPSTGIFGLYDLIGLDVMSMISQSLTANLEKNDKFLATSSVHPNIKQMIQEGYLGRKGKGGFYKVEIDKDGKKTKYVLDLKDFTYKPLNKQDSPQVTSDAFFKSNNELSYFIQEVLKEFFEYVLTNQPHICKDFYDIDRAMKLGFSWQKGPYQLMDELDMIPAKFASNFPKIDVSKLDTERSTLKNLKSKLNLKPLRSSDASTLWAINQKKLCLEIKTKMNTLSVQVFKDIIEASKIAEELHSDLIIYSDFVHFSVGADLQSFYDMALNNDMEGIRQYLSLGQESLNSLKSCKMPVISCASGVALGGGCELLFYSDYIIAHQELSAGLVETSLGLIPGFGGLAEAISSSSTQEMLNNRLNLIAKAYKSKSALDFGVSMGIERMSILPNANNLLDYALNCEFKKPDPKNMDTKLKIEHSIFVNLDEYQSDIIQVMLKNLPANIANQDSLLQAEQEIFCHLIKDTRAINKIKSIIKR